MNSNHRFTIYCLAGLIKYSGRRQKYTRVGHVTRVDEPRREGSVGVLI